MVFKVMMLKSYRKYKSTRSLLYACFGHLAKAVLRLYPIFTFLFEFLLTSTLSNVSSRIK